MRDDLPTGTVTFLFTDVEGSTRLLHELGDAYADALAEHRRVLRAAFGAHRGVEVDTQGDAFFVAFARASDAVAAARDAQAALAAGPIRVRIGLHTGEPLVTDEGYVGVDVHRAARIAAAGHGGQTLVSQATHDLAGSDGFRDLGDHRLKDLSAPERIWQLGDGEFPRLKTLHQPNLPVPATAFLGRESELAAVLDLLRGRARLVTLTGAGGSGKTRLALQAVAAASDQYPQGVWWLPLAPVSDSSAVLPAAARVFGGGAPVAELVGDRRLLLLLDNFEHVIDAAPELSSLLAACPNLDLLVTSRERLRLDGEHVYPVPTLARDESRILFVTRARAVRPDFEPDGHVDELCARLDDLPLAIELAAARVGLLSTRGLLERLGKTLDLLRGGRDAEQRQATLRATIHWSYDLLSREEQRLLAALSVFRGGWTLEAAEYVCEADVETLQSLVDKSLVRRWDANRFGMLETIREFADERLDGREELLSRLLDHLTAVGEAANVRPEAPGPQRHDVLKPERANIETVVEWSLRAGEIERGLRLLWMLENFIITNEAAATLQWVERLLAASAGVDPYLRAAGLRVRGGAAAFAGQHELEEASYLECREALEAIGMRDAAAHITQRLGFCALKRGDLDGAETRAEEAMELGREGGNDRDRPVGIALQAHVAWGRGDHERSVSLLRESARLAEECGFTWWHAIALGELSEKLLELDELDEAAGAHARSLELMEFVGDRLNILWSLALAAEIAGRRGEAERAGLLWGAIEAEVERAPAPGWRQPRVRFEASLSRLAGPAFEEGAARGRTLPLAEAVAVAVSVD